MKQYPHFLFRKIVLPSTQDEEGNWSGESESWVFHSVCREQPNGKGSVINGPDGKSIIFAAVVHIPVKTARIVENTEILVSESNTYQGVTRIKGLVLKYDSGQLHNRLWL